MNKTCNQMRCCEVQPTVHRGSASSWQSAGGCVGSGAMLLLLPKCPMCIAAYIAMFTGAGAAAPIAGYLRFVIAFIFAVSLVSYWRDVFGKDSMLTRKGGLK
jgi:hypothetical protein